MADAALNMSDPRSALWSDTAIAPPETPPLTSDRKTSVAVIGAGFTGLSSALHLAEAGVDTVVVEAEAPGFGASGRNNGQVVPAYSRHNPDDVVARFGKERGEAMNAWVQGAGRLVFDLIEKHGIDCDAAHNGWLMPAHNEKRLAVIRTKHDQWAARDADVAFLDRDQTVEMTGSEHYIGAFMHRRGGNIQPLSYTRGLAHAALKAGAAIHASTPVTAIEREAGKWRVRTPKGTVTADKVILATNAYVGSLWPGLGRSVVQMRLLQAATAPLSDNVAKTILPGRQGISDSRRTLWAFRKDGAGRIITGAAPLVPGMPGTLRDMCIKQLAVVYPQADEVEFTHLWDGMIAVTLDRLPRFHEVAEGVYAGLGYTGRGIAMATAMGKLLAARAQGAPAEDLPLPLSPMRPLPFQQLMIPLARLRMTWWRLLDRME